MTEKKSFITFAADTPRYPQLTKRVKIVCEQAKSLNYFDKIIGYTDQDLKQDKEYWNKCGNFIESNPRGYGFYLWKPYVVKRTMDEMNDNDILIYIDAGCTINPYAKKRLEEYVDIVRKSKHGIISFQMTHSSHKYTKKAVFDYLEVNEEDQKLDQFVAGILILRKNENTKKIVDDWYRITCIPEMINDQLSSSEHPEFIDNRHDQSILSILFHKYGSVVIPDETFFWPDWSKGIDYPIWATRIKN
jgi:hypothetical protein